MRHAHSEGDNRHDMGSAWESGDQVTAVAAANEVNREVQESAFPYAASAWLMH